MGRSAAPAPPPRPPKRDIAAPSAIRRDTDRPPRPSGAPRRCQSPRGPQPQPCRCLAAAAPGEPLQSARHPRPHQRPGPRAGYRAQLELASLQRRQCPLNCCSRSANRADRDSISSRSAAHCRFQLSSFSQFILRWQRSCSNCRQRFRRQRSKITHPPSRQWPGSRQTLADFRLGPARRDGRGLAFDPNAATSSIAPGRR